MVLYTGYFALDALGNFLKVVNFIGGADFKVVIILEFSEQGYIADALRFDFIKPFGQAL